MGETPVCTIDETGIHKPIFADCLAYFENKFKSIYGRDTYWAPDDRDTQFMSLLAEALDDVNGGIVSAYNSRDPGNAIGVGLSAIVKINGIKRITPGYSTVDVVVVGQVGAIINGGAIRDKQGNLWRLPDVVTIPLDGQIIVTATCATLGAILAAPGELSEIATPTQGWQTVTNLSDAAPGAPVELDAQLRMRQELSTSLPALNTVERLRGALLAVQGVSRLRVYENDTWGVDENAIPPKSLAVVVSGGTVPDVADAILKGKGTGAGTHGTQSTLIEDSGGTLRRVFFSRPAIVPVTYVVKLRRKTGYTIDVENAIKKLIADWTNAHDFGDAVILTRSYNAANAAAVKSYQLVDIYVARDGALPSKDDVVLAYNEEARCLPAHVSVQVVS